jgi:hypothetical protein
VEVDSGGGGGGGGGRRDAALPAVLTDQGTCLLPDANGSERNDIPGPKVSGVDEKSGDSEKSEATRFTADDLDEGRLSSAASKNNGCAGSFSCHTRGAALRVGEKVGATFKVAGATWHLSLSFINCGGGLANGRGHFEPLFLTDVFFFLKWQKMAEKWEVVTPDGR